MKLAIVDMVGPKDAFIRKREAADLEEGGGGVMEANSHVWELGIITVQYGSGWVD